MDHQRSDAVIDEVIKGELDAALAVEPSPEFLARVWTRVAAEPATTWRLSWTLALIGGAVALAAVAVTLSVSGRSDGSGSEATAQLIATRLDLPAAAIPSDARSIVLGATTATTVAPAVVSQHLSATAASRPESVATQTEPEVLIDAREAAALRRFLAGIREGHVDAALIPDVSPATAALQPLREIVVAPIALELPAPAGAEGVRQ